MLKFFLCAFFCFFLIQSSSAQKTEIQYLSGTDKDHTVNWDFYINTGMKSRKWNKIPVPSNWELQGFGTYNYFNDAINPEEEGLYKFNFKTSATNTSKKTFIVFEGALTDTEVKINGKLAGPVHQGGFYRFKYDITNLLNASGSNLLEVKVSKKSAEPSINKAERDGDYWQMGGIFRPVYLEIVPVKHIERIAVDVEADGTLALDVFTENAVQNSQILVELFDLKGLKIGTFNSNIDKEKTSLTHKFNGIDPWNPESPKLYQLKISYQENNKTIHTISQKIGFRTVDLRLHDGIYVNDVRVIFKGVNRHSFWPESGRTMSKALSILDVKLMKEMNMNAVRMSHYPPDQHFLDVCDSLGLFVIDELTGWQKKYDTQIGRKLVKELVVRDVNHPSIVLWANGNEGGFNRDLDDDYNIYDLQKRPVIHPWEKFRGTDTRHYPDYNYMVNAMQYGTDIFFPTEFMHGNFDGGMGAGLQDFWDMMLKHPLGAGGFLWSFADEGVIRTDKNGAMDLAGNNAPDGVVGPHREKEGSFRSIKKIWSPIVVHNEYLPQNFDGKLKVENRYLYSSLSKCNFQIALVNYSKAEEEVKSIVGYKAELNTIDLKPGETGFLNLNLPKNWKNNDALVLTAFDQNGLEVYSWSWPIQLPEKTIKKNMPIRSGAALPKAEETENTVKITDGMVEVAFDKKTGLLKSVSKNDKTLSLSNGPVLAQARAEMKMKYFKNYKNGDDVVIETAYEGKEWLNVKWTFSSGKPVKLEYQYSEKGYDQQIGYDFTGITFSYPEALVTGMKWLGNGADRVYKNRLAGAEFGLWSKKYNDGITGEKFDYPEFKGYYGNMYWLRIENKESAFTVYTEDMNTYFQMLKPKNADSSRESTKVAYPNGDIGFLNSIAPIGTKFQKAELMGPTSQKNIQLNYSPISKTLWFDFR